MTRRRWLHEVRRTALVVAATVLNSCCSTAPAAEPGLTAYSIRWTPTGSVSNQFTVEVTGINLSTAAQLMKASFTQSEWQRLFVVRADPGDLQASVGLPGIAGTYQVEADAIRFVPQFPFEAGLTYSATFHPNLLPGDSNGRLVTSVFHLPKRILKSTTIVSNVFPTADVLPENLLKFYLVFSAPMSAGHIYEHIHLRDASSGKQVELPFLEIDEELWNPSMTRLTLFIDPGRIKRGVQPLEEVGPALEEGKRYTLAIDANWRDAANLPLRQGYEKTFRVGPSDRTPIDLARWKLKAPRAGAHEELQVTFGESLDHALALRVIQVLDNTSRVIEGETRLADHERRWLFVPAKPWRRGLYTLSVQTTMEDLAGNNIGKAFEVDLFEGVQRRFTNSTVKLPFTAD